MPEEILIIVVISILSGTAISMLRLILGYRERKLTVGSPQGSSLTTSELERMMKRAVEEATESLTKKIDDLEFEVATKNAPARLKSAESDLLLDVELDEVKVEESRVRRSRDHS